MNSAYLSLGSNEGNRALWLHKSLILIAANCGKIQARSSIYETAAWGITNQAAFLNMAVCVVTPLDAGALLQTILDIETTLGRHRTVKWGPRTIDIDILFFNHEIIAIQELTVPHPFIQDRRFTLAPLAEIAPHYVHPKLMQTVAELLAKCPDTLEVTITDESA